MDPELQKLVDAGKLTLPAASELEKLKPGTFCLHKSWGFGRVSDWNLLLNQIVIDFAGKKSHPMQAQYAAENLTPLAPEHFLARKATNLASIKELAREDPVALVRNIIESLGGQATAAQVSEWLVGDVLSEDGMETLVGIHKEVTQRERRFFHSCEKDGANPTARRRCVARRRANCFVQQGAAAKRANRGTRSDHKISPTIQRT